MLNNIIMVATKPR